MAINSRLLKFSSRILGVELEEEQSRMLKSAECRYLVEVLHVKSLSPCMKDDVPYYLHLILL